MKKFPFLLTVLFCLQTITYGAQRLTINGQDVEILRLLPGQPCTIEIVSDDNEPYTVGSYGLPSTPGITPIAGTEADLIETVPEYGLWNLTAAGDNIEPGVHFIFGIDRDFTFYLLNASWNETIDVAQVIFDPDIIPPFRSAFTYNGRLSDAGSPAEGYYDQKFSIFYGPTADDPLTDPIVIEDVHVVDGYFTVDLDFGSDVFDGKVRYLQIAVRAGEITDPNSFVVLSPRQEITATPYAVRAKSAESVDIDTIFASPPLGWGRIPQVTKDMRLGNSVLRQNNLNVGIAAVGDLSDRLVLGSTADSESFLTLNSKWTGQTGIRFRSEPLGAELVYDQYKKALSYSTMTDVATGLVERIHVAKSGNVGIGVTSPQNRLHVAGYVQATSGYKFPDGTVQTTAAVQSPGGTITGIEAGTGLQGGGYSGNVSLEVQVPLVLYGDTSGAVIVGKNETGNYGVKGESDFVGVYGIGAKAGVRGSTNVMSGFGVHGSATGDQGMAVVGIAEPRFDDTGLSYGGYFYSSGKQGIGAYGKALTGILGESDVVSGIGVQGKSTQDKGIGVQGISTQQDGIGVKGTGETGVSGFSNQSGGKAVYGRAEGSVGTAGLFESVSGNAIHAVTESAGTTRSAGHFEATDNYGVGIFSSGGIHGYAAVFEGNVLLRSRSDGSSIMELGEGLDYAEGFDVTGQETVEPGTVLIIDPQNPGKLTISNSAYDKKVAGIVAGADGLGSGVRLGAGKFDKDVALAGRVYCNVDATQNGIEPGDLLTTSEKSGHAMKVTDYNSAQGAVLGKAMEKLEKGKTGRILVLVTLQ